MEINRQIEVAQLLNDVSALDSQTTFTHENCAALILAVLSGLDGGQFTLRKMSFPAHSLRDKRLKGITFEGCFFANSTLENSSWENCKFFQCHFSKLDVQPTTLLTNVSMIEVTVDSLSIPHREITVYDPAACRAQLAQLGISFPEGVQMPLSIKRRQPEEAVVLFGRVLRAFQRTTHLSENMIRTKLGGGGNMFMSDCIPALTHRGIFVELDHRGAGLQRHWKLGRPMAALNEALVNCGGLFSQFLDLASR